VRARERLGKLGVVLARSRGDPRSTRVWRQGADGAQPRSIDLWRDRLMLGEADAAPEIEASNSKELH